MNGTRKAVMLMGYDEMVARAERQTEQALVLLSWDPLAELRLARAAAVAEVRAHAAEAARLGHES